MPSTIFIINHFCEGFPEISGQVVRNLIIKNSSTGKGISGVTVIGEGKKKFVKTDREGKYRLIRLLYDHYHHCNR